MKKLIFFLLILGSFATLAQVGIYPNSARNAFYGIGGYSFTQEFFPNGVQPTPYVVSGPSPQNDFSYSVMATGGINNDFSSISTNNPNTSITITFNGNNIRKFGCQATALIKPSGTGTAELVRFTISTNLSSITYNQTVSQSEFVGFQILDENAYFTSVTATFVNPSSNYIAFNRVMVGDNSPQNAALNFDGDNDYVSIPSNGGNNTGNFVSFTVTCWIKPDAIQTTSATDPSENDILSKWEGLGSGTNNKYPFVIRYLNTTRTNVNDRGKILVGIWDGTNFPTIISNTAVNDGKWHHVAFVKAGNPTNTLTLYIDGVLNGSTTNTTTSTTINNTPLQIGRRGNVQNYFRGDIDEVRIWSVTKSQATIQAEMYCKNPNTIGLQAAYNFSNGVPHEINPLITQVQDASTFLNHGTLNSFALTGDVSNFVTGQVRYVSGAFTGANNGSSWANGFDQLQSALSNNTCNDLFDVYVAKGFSDYKPSIKGNANESFIIPLGMSIYGGFAGTEKSINQRNMALIHTTYKTTLSGDLFSNDTPFNFSSNRTDNSEIVVQVNGNNAIFDGFTVKGSKSSSGGLYISGSNTNIKNSRIVDNSSRGIVVLGNNASIMNCFAMGNGSSGIYVQDVNTNFNNNLAANNEGSGIFIYIQTGNYQSSFTNCTITANGNLGIIFSPSAGTSLTNLVKNSLIYGNDSGGINTLGSGTINNTITYSLVQGVNTGTGNLDGNTVNPQFVSPLANNVRNDTGEYRLKDSSPCINVGDDEGVSPLDLDRNPRPKGGKTDMGAYESYVNMNEIISIINGNWESSSTWNLDRVPLPTDKVIMNGHTVTVTTNTAKAKIIEQKPSSDLKFNSGGSLELNQ